MICRSCDYKKNAPEGIWSVREKLNLRKNLTQQPDQPLHPE